MHIRKRLALLTAAAGIAVSLCGCNLFYRIEPTEEPPVEEVVEVEPVEEVVEIDSPIVGTWHNTYTSDGTTSILTFYPDGTGKETDQSDAEPGSMVVFTYTVIEDYVEITVDTTTLQFTYVIDGENLEMTYRGHSIAD